MGVIASLLLCEGLLSIWDVLPHFVRLEEIPADMFEPDDVLGWRFKTRLNVKITNSNGLMNEEFPKKKAPGEYRILVLGDSLAVANNKDSFPRLLEKKITASKKSSVRVINAGIPGYNNFQEWIYLSTWGIEFEPDLAILALFIGNDIMDNLRYNLKPAQSSVWRRLRLVRFFKERVWKGKKSSPQYVKDFFFAGQLAFGTPETFKFLEWSSMNIYNIHWNDSEQGRTA